MINPTNCILKLTFSEFLQAKVAQDFENERERNIAAYLHNVDEIVNTFRGLGENVEYHMIV